MTSVILLFLLCILLSIAFYTLLERKFLSLSQNRLGPNKVLLKGILQPVLDGIKLFFKESVIYKNYLSESFSFAPMIAFTAMLMLWSTLPSFLFYMNFTFSGLMVLSLVGVLVYSTLLAGWGSYSKYAMIGAMRSCSQTISYEISLALLFISILLLVKSMSLSFFYDLNWSIFFYISPVLGMWWISTVAENNRAPFDFAEGESELISGFNIEYSSGGFVLLFLGEYGMILFFSALTTLLFFSNWFLMFPIFFSMVLFIRSSYPRSRYDKLMQMMWFKFLPLSIFFLFIQTVSL